MQCPFDDDTIPAFVSFLLFRYDDAILFLGLRDRLELTGPDLSSNVADELELVPHLLMFDVVSFTVTGEPALRREGDPVQRFLFGLPGSFCHHLGCAVHLFDNLLLVFRCAQLGGQHTEHCRKGKLATAGVTFLRDVLLTNLLARRQLSQRSRLLRSVARR